VIETFSSPTIPRLVRWVMDRAWRRRAPLVGVLAATLLRTGLDVLKPWPMVLLVDYVLGGRALPGAVNELVRLLPGAPAGSALIGWCVAATVLLFLASWAVGLAQDYASLSLAQRMVYDLGGEVLARVERLSLYFPVRAPSHEPSLSEGRAPRVPDSRRWGLAELVPPRFRAREQVLTTGPACSGDLIRRVTTDCACVGNIARDALLPVLSGLVSLGLMGVIMWRLSPSLTALALVVGPCMALVFLRYARPMVELSEKQQEAEARGCGVIEQTLTALPVVQAFGCEERRDQAYRERNREALDATLALTRVQLKFKMLMGVVIAAATAGLIWMGARQAMAGEASVGTILLFLSYLASLYVPLQSVIYTSVIIQGASGSAARVWQVLAAREEVPIRPGALPLRIVQGRVRFEDVTAGYEHDVAMLRDVSLEARSGEIVAVVGPTGAGKSTLLSLLPRFLDPWKGRVLIDDTDVREVDLKSLRSQIGLVPQEPFLFPQSVADNIAYGRPGASRSEIEAAARDAGAHEFIQALPHGYATVLGERGASLSLGQRQRLSIARALLIRAPILLFDEPTSALDAEAERSFLNAIDRLAPGRTIFIIAHRLSTVRRATRVVVLREGVVVESGNPEEVLARDGGMLPLA
jgi:ATP-binding cassette, subfamily B, bacterial